jgi:hypothetical protein
MNRLTATMIAALLVGSSAWGSSAWAQQPPGALPLVVYVKEPAGRVVMFRANGATRTSEFDRLITKRTDPSNPPLLSSFLQPIGGGRFTYQPPAGAVGPASSEIAPLLSLSFLTGSGGAVPAGWGDFKVKGYAFRAVFLESPQPIDTSALGIPDARQNDQY